MLFIGYPKCSTCQKAKKWLDEHNIEYIERHIVEDNPTYDELKKWYATSEHPLKKFFNTSGLLYKEKQLKDKIPTMNEDERLKLLATNGMLVKRPLVVKGDIVLVAFMVHATIKNKKYLVGSEATTPQVNPQDKTQVTPQDKILEFCKIPRSKNEIVAYMGYKDPRYFTKEYMKPLLKNGELVMTIPDKPNSKNQKYVTKK